MNIAHLLISQAQQRPDAPAIIEANKTLSFRELDHESAKASVFLARHGIGPGDHVLVFVPMSINLYVALLGIFRAGAVAVFLDPSAGRKHIDRCCEIIQPAALIAISKAHVYRLVSPALRKIPRKFAVGWSVIGSKRWAFPDDVPDTRIVDRTPDDRALVTFTSGSTGKPKAAVRTHGFLAAQHAALHRAIDLSPGQIDLTTLPIFVLANLASGATSVIPNADLRHVGSVRTSPILGQIQRHNITRAVASPAFFEQLLTNPLAAESMQTFQRLYTGGAPVFPRLLRQLHELIPTAKVVAVYGSTEAEPIADIAWDQISDPDITAMLPGAGLLAGPVVPEIRLRVINNQFGQPMLPMTGEEFEACTCAPDAPGEIVVTGDHVLKTYLNGEGDSETKFKVGDEIWHRTGDAGYLDPNSRLWLLGRAQARITDEQGTIYPFAVECAASQIDGVRRSALISFEGKRLLAVEPRSAASADLPRQIAAALPWAKLHEVRLVRHIPVDKRHNAKVDYPALSKLVRTRRGTDWSGSKSS